jgi:hypothetical protein
LRTLEDRVDLLKRVRDRATQSGHRSVAGRYQDQVEETRHRAATIRRVLLVNHFPDQSDVVPDLPDEVTG